MARGLARLLRPWLWRSRWSAKPLGYALSIVDSVADAFNAELRRNCAGIRRAAYWLVNMAIRRSLHRCFLLPSAPMPPIAPVVTSKRPESFIPPLAHLPRPIAFAPRQSSSLSREPPAGRAAYSSEHAFAQFITRMKAEPFDQIAGDCRDLFSRRVKEWQSHRGGSL